MYRRLGVGVTALAATASGLSMYKPLECASESVNPLSAEQFRSFEIQEVKQITPDTTALRVKFADNDQSLNMPMTSCVVFRAEIDGKTIVRPYTPVSTNADKGHMDYVVKGYPTGLLSKHLCGLKKGDTVEVKGPYNKYNYVRGSVSRIGFVAGGSGITPMLQLIQHIIEDPEDDTELHLVFANKCFEDIILREQLEMMAVRHPQFRVHFVLEEKKIGYRHSEGYVTPDVIKFHLPPPREDHHILVCGPPPMMAALCGPKGDKGVQGELTGTLRKMGYKSPEVYKF